MHAPTIFPQARRSENKAFRMIDPSKVIIHHKTMFQLYKIFEQYILFRQWNIMWGWFK